MPNFGDKDWIDKSVGDNHGRFKADQILNPKTSIKIVFVVNLPIITRKSAKCFV